MANGKESLAEMRDGLPQLVNTPELRFDCPEERKFERRRGGQGAPEDRPAPRSTTSTACGSAPRDGWWLLRASNTQPVLVARCEAPDEAGLERLMSDLKAALSASGVSLPDEAAAGHH